MKLCIFSVIVHTALGLCDRIDREPLTYATVPEGTYVPPKNSNVTTLLDFIKSRDDLTSLAGVLAECGGMPCLFPSENRGLIPTKGFFKPSIPRQLGPIRSLHHQIQHSTIPELTTPRLSQHQRANGGWAT